MQLSPHEHLPRTDIWREGTWLDLWSVVHFLSGASLGFGFSFLGFGALPSIVIVALLLVLYEMWEALAHIHETPQNRAADVLVGLASFVPTFLFVAPLYAFSDRLCIFLLVLSLNIFLSVLGWRASKKAAAFEARMRVRYHEGRARLSRRRSRMRTKNLHLDKTDV
jgi:hypothetical protein